MEVAIRLKGSEKALGKDGTYATIVPPIIGDVNGDNMVTGLDYSAVIMCFGYAVDDPEAPSPTPNCDFNNDGYVTGLDYSAVIMNFGLSGADMI